MNENKEKTMNPIVNEEYDEREPLDGCCCSNEGQEKRGGSTHSCCGGHGTEQAGHECQCKNDPDPGSLEQRLEQAEEKQDEYLRLAQQIKADFENYKRRNRNALADAHQTASADVVEAFLPVLDNLDRAIESISSAGADESVLKGIELVRRQFLDTLSKLGVEEIEALGEPFDPELHNAVGQMEAEEDQEENTIVMVHQKGYKMGGHVIRYSMVHVAR